MALALWGKYAVSDEDAIVMTSSAAVDLLLTGMNAGGLPKRRIDFLIFVHLNK